MAGRHDEAFCFAAMIACIRCTVCRDWENHLLCVTEADLRALKKRTIQRAKFDLSACNIGGICFKTPQSPGKRKVVLFLVSLPVCEVRAHVVIFIYIYMYIGICGVYY